MASRQNQQPAAAALDQVTCQLLITCYDREVGGEGGGEGAGVKAGARRGEAGDTRRCSANHLRTEKPWKQCKDKKRQVQLPLRLLITRSLAER